jgi:magnesium-transporting ATPase (P-type)
VILKSLGAISVIATGKTSTLTVNRVEVRQLYELTKVG